MTTLAAETHAQPAAVAASETKASVRMAAAVRGWVWTIVLLTVAMVAVGGATRLTGSGLSITEWKPVTGAIPPLSSEAWIAEFEKYRGIDQYRLMNAGMSLAEFQVIYWWEWGHRQLGRLLGLAFFIPLVFFWLKGAVKTPLALTLVGIGALGGLQATVGWIMVASGLEPGMTAVAPIKLTAHLTIATLILALLTWVAVGLSPRQRARSSPAVRASAWAKDILARATIVFKIALGSASSPQRAGSNPSNTWPFDGLGGFAPSRSRTPLSTLRRSRSSRTSSTTFRCCSSGSTTASSPMRFWRCSCPASGTPWRGPGVACPSQSFSRAASARCGPGRSSGMTSRAASAAPDTCAHCDVAC